MFGWRLSASSSRDSELVYSRHVLLIAPHRNSRIKLNNKGAVIEAVMDQFVSDF